MPSPKVRSSRARASDAAQLLLDFQPEAPASAPVVVPLCGASRFAEQNGYREMASEALALQSQARELLRIHGAARIANELQVQWNPRLTTCAGRADYHKKVISLNPRLREHPGEVECTLLHEVAHLLAQFRHGRRRIRPHGTEWRKACADLGIPDEKRCHTLPFPVRRRARRFLYKCPNCARDFPRVRKIRRAIACRACCLAHNGGEFDARFRLRLEGHAPSCP